MRKMSDSPTSNKVQNDIDNSTDKIFYKWWSSLSLYELLMDERLIENWLDDIDIVNDNDFANPNSDPKSDSDEENTDAITGAKLAENDPIDYPNTPSGSLTPSENLENDNQTSPQ